MTEDALECWKLLQPTWPVTENAEAMIVNQWLLGTDMQMMTGWVEMYYKARPNCRSRLLMLIGVVL